MDAYWLRYVVQREHLPNTADGGYRYFADASHIAGLLPFHSHPNQTSEYRFDGTVPASLLLSPVHQFLHPMARCLLDKSGCHLCHYQVNPFRYQNESYRQSHTPPPVVEMPEKPASHKDGYGHRNYGCPTIPLWHTGHGQ